MIVPLTSLLFFCLLALIHGYAGYPIWWRLFGRRFPVLPAVTQAEDQDLPTVTIIVAAYNEASCIASRVRNLVSLNYPHELVSIFIESDGSDDDTVKQAVKAAGDDIRLIVSDHKERRGKVRVLNEACQRAVGDILVFSDANVSFEQDALRSLVARFRDQEVGCVCGKLLFRVPEGRPHAATEGLYWKLESWLKEQEGARGVLLGANGAIYAMRRSLWNDCPRDMLVEDFFIPLRLLMHGHRIVFEPEAKAFEDLPPTIQDEFGRRVRIGAGDFQILSRSLGLLSPRHGLAAWAFLSRKVLRWLGPFFMIGTLVSGVWLAALHHWLGVVALLGWGAFISIALMGMKAHQWSGRLGSLVGAVAHFAGMNLALLFGFFRWLFKTQGVTWKRTAR
jgi:cellulose synthase/poly-beta-1,6-N-acetylglucosamine synthase-like glycosyltransferase